MTRAIGRVFFTLNKARYACSGTVVAPDVVLTAAHCVSDGAGEWADDWTFVPGYAAGKAPYGTYRARIMYVSSAWAAGADPGSDVAFVTVTPVHPGAVMRDVLPISFGSTSRQAFVFGYPAAPPYTGQTLDYCAGPVTPDPYGAADSGIACTMTEGDSGGPWLSGFTPAAGTGIIMGVTSFRYTGQAGTLYSPVLGDMARKLYAAATAKSLVSTIPGWILSW